MPIRVALSVALLIALNAPATAASVLPPKQSFAANEDIAPMKGRVGVKVTEGRLGSEMLVCPEPGLLRMVIKAKDQQKGQTMAANMGCFDLNKGDKIEIVDRMPANDEPASHLCVKASPNQKACRWILNVGIKAD